MAVQEKKKEVPRLIKIGSWIYFIEAGLITIGTIGWLILAVQFLYSEENVYKNNSWIQVFMWLSIPSLIGLFLLLILILTGIGLLKAKTWGKYTALGVTCLRAASFVVAGLWFLLSISKNGLAPQAALGFLMFLILGIFYGIYLIGNIYFTIYLFKNQKAREYFNQNNQKRGAAK